ncbi:hypothetical protein B0O99DRAFT_638149 [Bisporella sp. PMI_857]|nr:hypothetical protein B0O99DRAFT_638149 [Bisporella sp. PMI_857]
MYDLSALCRKKRPAAHDADGDEVRRPRKRERYTRIACESCKSRKVKCSGSPPCSRCSELNVECTYNDYVPQQHTDNAAIRRDQKGRMSIDAIPQDLVQLLSRMKRTCDEIQSSTTCFSIASPSNPSITRRRLQSKDAGFRDTTSPTNFIYSLNLARSNLEQRRVLLTLGHNNASPWAPKDAA